MNPHTSVISSERYTCDSDEDLSEDQILEILAQFTLESLADEPDY